MLRRPTSCLLENGTLVVHEQTVPSIRDVETFSGWEDLIVKEKLLWGQLNITEEDILRRRHNIQNMEEFNQRILEARRFANMDFYHIKPKRVPFISIITPKIGAYCELMQNDKNRLRELVRKLRERYGREKLQIVNITVDTRQPLCEVFFTGSIPEQIRIFYARGGTLQPDVCSRFWTFCDILGKDERLQTKYGGIGCPGLFPKWDLEGILEEVDECMQNIPPYAMKYPMNSDWQNAGSWVPENEKLRAWWLQNVHFPTRRAVQMAFENGVEDFREIIKKEYDILLRMDALNRSTKK